MHDAGAGVEGVARLGGHLRRRHRHRVLLRVGQHAGQRAGQDGLVQGLCSSGSSSTSTAAGGHRLARRDVHRLDAPAQPASSHISIFMASTQTSGAPASTQSPTATATLCHHAGHRREGAQRVGERLVRRPGAGFGEAIDGGVQGQLQAGAVAHGKGAALHAGPASAPSSPCQDSSSCPPAVPAGVRVRPWQASVSCRAHAGRPTAGRTGQQRGGQRQASSGGPGAAAAARAGGGPFVEQVVSCGLRGRPGAAAGRAGSGRC
jgi:hypothetical protein